jgi:hypothetical protein
MKHPVEIIGATDVVDLPELGWLMVPVRVDSGATTSSIHCSRVELISEDHTTVLRFYLDARRGAPPQSFTVKNFKETIVRSSSGKAEKRYVIKTSIKIFGRKIRTEFTLANRKKMRYPILLGRKLLKGRFIIDVAQKDLSVKHSKNKTNPKSLSEQSRL